MDEADQLSDRISIIDHGKIIITGTNWELKNTLGQDLIYLETSNNTSAITSLTGLSFVKNMVQKSKGILVMINDDGTKVLPVIMDRLRDAGITISTVNLKKPSMDDVFIHYTGKEIRDEPVGKASILSLRPGGN
jgi:ABC-2 type transport system ATP-binding protein